MNADNLSSIQLYFLKYLRTLLPTKLISYTFPGYKSEIDFPFRDLLQYGHQYLNTVNANFVINFRIHCQYFLQVEVFLLALGQNLFTVNFSDIQFLF